MDFCIHAKLMQHDFIMLQETHVPGNSDVKIDQLHFKNWRMISSGKGGNDKSGGVSTILSSSCHVEEICHVIPGHILRIKLRIKGQKFILINCYAPDETKCKIVKRKFWMELNKSLQNCPKGYNILTGGDFNATLHPTETFGFGRQHPKCCYEKSSSTSSNGLYLLESLARHRLFLENTYRLNRRACHSFTFQSPLKYKRRLDYFLVNGIIHSGTIHCRSHNPPTFIKSDHKMLVIKFKIKCKWLRKQIRLSKKSKKFKPAINVQYLVKNETVKREYQTVLENLCTNVESDMNDLDFNAREELLTSKLSDAAEMSIPKYRKNDYIPWLTQEYIDLRKQTFKSKCKNKLNQLKKLKIKLQTEFIQGVFPNVSPNTYFK